MPAPQPWIGLVEVRKLPDCEVIGCPGAFVNVIASASTEEDFRLKVLRKCENLRLAVSEIEDVEPFAKRISEHHVDEELKDLAEQAETASDDVLFGTFHTYLRDEG